MHLRLCFCCCDTSVSQHGIHQVYLNVSFYLLILLILRGHDDFLTTAAQLIPDVSESTCFNKFLRSRAIFFTQVQQSAFILSCVEMLTLISTKLLKLHEEKVEFPYCETFSCFQRKKFKFKSLNL